MRRATAGPYGYVSRFGPQPERDFYMLPHRLIWDSGLDHEEFRILVAVLDTERRGDDLPSLRTMARKWSSPGHLKAHGRIGLKLQSLQEKGFLLISAFPGEPSEVIAAYPPIPPGHAHREAFELEMRDRVAGRILRASPRPDPNQTKLGEGWERFVTTPERAPQQGGNESLPVVVTDPHQLETEHLSTSSEDKKRVIHAEPPQAPAVRPRDFGLFSGPEGEFEPPLLEPVAAPPVAPKTPRNGGRKLGSKNVTLEDATALVRDKLTPEQSREFKLACEGYQQRTPILSWSKEGKAITEMVRRGHLAVTILACYDKWKPTRGWSDRHLSMVWISQNLEAWLQSLTPHQQAAIGYGSTDGGNEHGRTHSGRARAGQSPAAGSAALPPPTGSGGSAPSGPAVRFPDAVPAPRPWRGSRGVEGLDPRASPRPAETGE